MSLYTFQFCTTHLTFYITQSVLYNTQFKSLRVMIGYFKLLY